MVDFGGWAMAIASGLAGGAVVFGLSVAAKSRAPRRGRICLLTYSTPVRLLALAMIPLTLFVVYAMMNASPGQMVMALLVACGFVAGTVFLVYQVFFVRFGYDRNFVYFDSPFCRNKCVAWENLENVGYSLLVQAHYIEVAGIGRIWCSSFLNGHDEFGQFLESKTRTLIGSGT
ncbi:hypothetical protein ABLO27_01295 [Roseibium sp. SCPC15]|uniref:hypothetical protein n=1 Tax=Roseibium sp. SCP15 TaxID=3141376 RepID=UPI0033350DB9